MTQYFLGVDIGGTKSHALVADEHGHAVGFGEYSAGSYEVVEWDGLRKALHAITTQALDSAHIAKTQLAGVGFGIAGYDWPGELEGHQQAIATLALPAPYGLVNDTVIGLMAGTSAGWGLGVVSGTGSNCWGRDRHGHEGHVTGGGPNFGEYAGGYDLVDKATHIVAQAWTQSGPPTRLTEAFLELTGARDATDLLEGLYLKRYTVDGTNAPLIFQVAQQGDAGAQAAIHWAGCELGKLANGVIRQLNFQTLGIEIVLIGSLFKGGALLINPMMETVHNIAPGAKTVRLTVPPVVGGVLLGMEQAGVDYPPLRQTLIETTAAILNQHL